MDKQDEAKVKLKVESDPKRKNIFLKLYMASPKGSNQWQEREFRKMRLNNGTTSHKNKSVLNI